MKVILYNPSLFYNENYNSLLIKQQEEKVEIQAYNKEIFQIEETKEEEITEEVICQVIFNFVNKFTIHKIRDIKINNSFMISSLEGVHLYLEGIESILKRVLSIILRKYEENRNLFSFDNLNLKEVYFLQPGDFLEFRIYQNNQVLVVNTFSYNNILHPTDQIFVQKFLQAFFSSEKNFVIKEIFGEDEKKGVQSLGVYRIKNEKMTVYIDSYYLKFLNLNEWKEQIGKGINLYRTLLGGKKYE